MELILWLILMVLVIMNFTRIITVLAVLGVIALGFIYMSIMFILGLCEFTHVSFNKFFKRK